MRISGKASHLQIQTFVRDQFHRDLLAFTSDFKMILKEAKEYQKLLFLLIQRFEHSRQLN